MAGMFPLDLGCCRPRRWRVGEQPGQGLRAGRAGGDGGRDALCRVAQGDQGRGRPGSGPACAAVPRRSGDGCGGGRRQGGRETF